MKRFVLAIAFTCAISGTVLAGNIPTDGAASPTTQSSSVAAMVILTIVSLVSR